MYKLSVTMQPHKDHLNYYPTAFVQNMLMFCTVLFPQGHNTSHWYINVGIDCVLYWRIWRDHGRNGDTSASQNGKKTGFGESVTNGRRQGAGPCRPTFIVILLLYVIEVVSSYSLVSPHQIIIAGFGKHKQKSTLFYVCC
jgi:hypothetical protein